MTTRLAWRRLLAMLVALGVLAAACGDDEGEEAISSEASETDTGAGAGDSDDAAGDTDAGSDEPDADGGDSGAGAASPENCTAGVAGDGRGGDAPEVTSVQVAALPLVDFAALFYAAECGFFEAEGLSVEVEIAQGGPVAVQLLLAGDVEFSFVNWLSFAQIVANGAPAVVVANGTWLADGQGGIYVLEDSPIESPEDLVGADLGVNTTGNVGDIATASRLEELGIEGQPEWVEMGFPDIVPAIESGAIDGGMLTEPFTTFGQLAGLRQVLDIYTGRTQNLPIAGYVSSSSFASENPATVAAFRNGIEAATELLAADEAALRAYIPLFSQVPPEAAEVLILPIYQTSLTVDDLQAPADLMADLGFLDEPIDMTPHVVLG